MFTWGYIIHTVIRVCFENDLKPFLATVIGDIDDKSVVSFMLVLCSMRQIDKPIFAQTCLAVWINARRWKI